MRWRYRSAMLALMLPLAAGCADSSVSLAPLTVEDAAIHDAAGDPLLEIDAVPGSIRVDAESEFGAAQRFTAAALSPDERRLALTTQGAAHGAGWLLALDGGTLRPTAFQYGGEVEPGPWRDDGGYVVFAMQGPAPSRSLVVVAGDASGETMEANARPVRIPEHADGVPPGSDYRALEWQDDSLLFEVDGEGYRLDPTSGEVVQAR